MLIQFNFSNYKSFKEKTTLDLSATKENELSYHIRNINNEKILPVAIIYGANASGKSNIQEALVYMQKMVLQSLNYGEESRQDKYLRAMPFMFDKKSESEASSFEVYFTNDDEKGFTYNYGFSLDDAGIVEEWLNSKAKTARKYKPIFYRNRNDLDLNGLSAKNRDNLKIALNDKTLLVSLGAKLQVEKLKAVYLFFKYIDITNFGEPFENYILSRQVPAHLDDDENVKKNVLKYFSSFDNSIVDLKTEVIKEEDDKGYNHLAIDTGHKIEGTDDIKYIPLRMESAGTLKMFALYPYVQEVLNNGGLLFVDELNARLHPLLVRTFVQLFLDPKTNQNNAQLIFTSHDSWQLNNGTFRRDEIWFTEKDESGVSKLYSLADFVSEDGKTIRSDENYEKNYLLGKYGGIPMMRLFDVFRGDENEKK